MTLDRMISLLDHDIISSPDRRPWELMVWRSVRPSVVRPVSTFSFKRLLLNNY